MTSRGLDTVRTFRENTKLVLQLLDFDREIIEVAIGLLDDLAKEAEREHRLNSFARKIRNRAEMIRNIKVNDSLRPRYVTMFGQCVVLLVSYFGSAVESLFRTAVADALADARALPVIDRELKVSWRRLAVAEAGLPGTFAGLLVAQDDISFQDMQSIRRAFNDHLRVEIPRTVHTDNVILGQAARHVLVHSGGVVDGRMLKQVAKAPLRSLKTTLPAGTALEFTPAEVSELAESMIAELGALAEAVDEQPRPC